MSRPIIDDEEDPDLNPQAGLELSEEEFGAMSAPARVTRVEVLEVLVGQDVAPEDILEVTQLHGTSGSVGSPGKKLHS